MGRGTWWATVHGVTKSQAQLNNLTTAWGSFTFVPWEEQPYSGCLLIYVGVQECWAWLVFSQVLLCCPSILQALK